MNYHQGDIVLRRIEKIPDNAKKIRDELVATGEVTGHIHRIAVAEIFGLNNSEFVRVRSANPMTHDEHPPTDVVEVGDYEKIQQYEYFPEGELVTKD